MKKFFLLCLIFLPFFGFSQIKELSYVPELSEAADDDFWIFHFSGYQLNDVILVKDYKDSLVDKITFVSTADYQSYKISKKVRNFKLYAFKAAHGGTGNDICFKIRSMRLEEGTAYCISKAAYLLVDVDNGGMQGKDRRYRRLDFEVNIPFDEEAKPILQLNVRHDLGVGRKKRTDIVTVNSEDYTMGTDGEKYKSKCLITLKKKDDRKVIISFKSNKMGDDETIYLMFVLTVQATGERTSKPIRLKKGELVEYTINLKQKQKK